jgi:hypothetical protein
MDKEAEEEIEKVRDWYQQRANRLRRWVLEEVKPLSEEAATHYFAIWANGSPVPHEAADWTETMHGLRLRAELAEHREAIWRNESQRLGWPKDAQAEIDSLRTSLTIVGHSAKQEREFSLKLLAERDAARAALAEAEEKLQEIEERRFRDAEAERDNEHE